MCVNKIYALLAAALRSGNRREGGISDEEAQLKKLWEGYESSPAAEYEYFTL